MQPMLDLQTNFFFVVSEHVTYFLLADNVQQQQGSSVR